MAKQSINIGTSANDGSGTTLRDGADLINDNFNEIYTAIGDGTTLTTGTFVTDSNTVTLTNKTLTSPIISTISNTGTLTLPTSTDTLIGRATTDTLTNKTLTTPSIDCGIFTGTVTAGGGVGTNGQVLTSTGTGVCWAAASSGGASSLDGLSDVTYETTTENLGIGTNALDSLQVGAPYNPTGNIAIGFNAGTNVSIAGNNIIIGYNALCNGCNVGANVAIGCDALKELPQGTCNTAIGAGALRCQSNQTGQNTAVGAFAGANVTTGCRNTFIGIQSGYQAATYCENTIIGFKAMGGPSATGGHRNTIVGTCAGFSSQSACNVFIGGSTGYATTTGACNTFVGFNAGLSNTTATGNVAFGFCALRRNTTGATNTSIGFCAGVEGRGNNNIYVGAYTGGANCHTGCNNVLIGNSSTSSSTTVSNEITLGNTSHTSFRIPGLQSGASSGDVLTYNGTSLALSAPVGGGTTWSLVNCSNCPGLSIAGVAGEGYFIDVKCAAFSLVLPSSPSLGDEVTFKDVCNVSATCNAITISAAANIEGTTCNLVVSVNGAGNTLVYVDSTIGWVLKNK